MKMNERVNAPRPAVRRGAGTARSRLATGRLAIAGAPDAPAGVAGSGGENGNVVDLHLRARPASRVMVVDGDPIARCGMCAALDGTNGFTIVGQARDRDEAIRIAAGRCPQLVIIGASPTGGDAVELTRALVARDPSVRILLLTTTPDEDLTLQALQAGASGCLPKAVGTDALLRTMHRMLDGEVAVSRAFAASMVRSLRCQPKVWRPLRSRLTTREWEVVDILSEGACTREIAERLTVSETTVYTHIGRIFRKLGVHNRADAVEAAQRARAEEAAAEA
jgi:DNA-binding NarL/FixJ family response regulator